MSRYYELMQEMEKDQALLERTSSNRRFPFQAKAATGKFLAN